MLWMFWPFKNSTTQQQNNCVIRRTIDYKAISCFGKLADNQNNRKTGNLQPYPLFLTNILRCTTDSDNNTFHTFIVECKVWDLEANREESRRREIIVHQSHPRIYRLFRVSCEKTTTLYKDQVTYASLRDFVYHLCQPEKSIIVK